jgi:hypothetical protein
MKKLLILALFLLPTLAQAEPQRNPCFINSNGGCTAVSTANPLPVTSSGGGGTSDVNINSVGGNAVTTTVPVSGNVGITGTPSVSITGTATTNPAGTNFATSQVSVATSSTVTVAARTGRRSVTITNITGTQPVYCSGTTATTANGQYIPAVAGANFTVSTSAAINCIASTSAQTVSVAEAY